MNELELTDRQVSAIRLQIVQAVVANLPSISVHLETTDLVGLCESLDRFVRGVEKG